MGGRYIIGTTVNSYYYMAHEDLQFDFRRTTEINCSLLYALRIRCEKNQNILIYNRIVIVWVER